jgi:hypothetical protein
MAMLDYYLRRYGKANTAATRIARVTVQPVAEQVAGSFRLVLSNGRRIECGEAELAHLIRAAELA